MSQTSPAAVVTQTLKQEVSQIFHLNVAQLPPQNKLSKINAYFHPDRETRVEPILQSVLSNNRRRRGHDRCCQIL